MTKPPFFFLPSVIAQRLPPPPTWLLDDLRNRVVLLLNHVLQQEPEAMQRLRRHAGKTLHVRWLPGEPAGGEQCQLGIVLSITPAGLLACSTQDASADLLLTVDESSPWQLVDKLARGDKPAVSIEGDVQLAAEVAWLVDHVRWDVEEDLARLFGDALAHTLVRMGRSAAVAVVNGVQAVRAQARFSREREAARRAHDGTRGAAP